MNDIETWQGFVKTCLILGVLISIVYNIIVAINIGEETDRLRQEDFILDLFLLLRINDSDSIWYEYCKKNKKFTIKISDSDGFNRDKFEEALKFKKINYELEMI